MIERMRNGNSHRHIVAVLRLATFKVAGKKEIAIVAVLRPPLFCWIFYD